MHKSRFFFNCFVVALVVNILWRKKIYRTLNDGMSMGSVHRQPIQNFNLNWIFLTDVPTHSLLFLGDCCGMKIQQKTKYWHKYIANSKYPSSKFPSSSLVSVNINIPLLISSLQIHIDNNWYHIKLVQKNLWISIFENPT